MRALNCRTARNELVHWAPKLNFRAVELHPGAIRERRDNGEKERKKEKSYEFVITITTKKYSDCCVRLRDCYQNCYLWLKNSSNDNDTREEKKSWLTVD